MSRIPPPGRRTATSFWVLMAILAAQAQAETALSGPAHLLANAAYQAYSQGDYREAVHQTHAALRLRPEAESLKILLQRSREARNALRDNPAYVAPPLRIAGLGASAPSARAPAATPSTAARPDAVTSAADPAPPSQPAVRARGDKAPVPVDTPPLSGQAWLLADKAYKAYARGNYRDAVRQTHAALRLRPDAESLHRLLHNARQARDAAQKNPAFAAPALPALVQPAAAMPAAVPSESDPAFQAAASSYQAYARGNYPVAVVHAQRAVTLAPANRDYRLLLVNALSAANRLDEADEALSAGLAETQGDEQLAAQRESIRRRRAELHAAAIYPALARGDFDTAIASARRAVDDAPTHTNYRSALIRALLQGRRFEEAEQAASAAIALNNRDASLRLFRAEAYKGLGQAALAREDFAAALGIGGLAITLEIDLLADLEGKSAARQRFDAALTNGELAAVPDLQLAYLAVRVGHNTQALAAFKRADAAGTLAYTAYQDAAFAAVRTGDDAQAMAFFKRSLDSVNLLIAPATSIPASAAPEMTPQQRFEIRRAVAEVGRETGVIASLTYRGAVSGLGPAPNAAADSLQAGIEAYWRPWGYRNGRYTEVFARGFETLYSEGGGATGGDTLQTAVGIRHKPLSDINLVASFSRVFSPSGGRDDWLAQLGYSGGNGTDLRVDAPAWWTTRLAAELGRYLSAGQSFALFNAELGRSFRLGNPDGKWVVFPHLSFAADYDSTASIRHSLGIGPGVNLRYWFREDAYRAPQSTLDFLLQYRERLDGAARAEGVFLTITLSY